MRIQSKLFLAILGGSVVLVVTVMLLAQWSFARGLVDYVNSRQLERGHEVAGELAEYYREVGSWEALRRNPHLFHRILFNALENRDPNAAARPRVPRPPPPLALLDEERRPIAGMPPPQPTADVPINVDGRLVGWLLVPQVREIRAGFEEQFLRRQRSTLLLIGTVLLGVAALMALPLARHLVKPIKQLANGTHQLTQGNYTVSLPANRGDELGELARNFNELALTLTANDSSRKRWLADISHELRTPLAILRGELDAIIDGVRPADQAHLQSLQQEVQHLSRLVDDLYALTTADIGGLKYRKTECDIAELAREQCDAHRQPFADVGLQLRTTIPDHAVELFGDEDRLRQLLDNLLDNSRKYTHEGGQVHVQLTSLADAVELLVEDSAPAVPTEALPRLFDHLFRVDDSRNRATGGSGLGLAICQRIVTAHQGTIEATPSALGGLAIRVRLPYR